MFQINIENLKTLKYHMIFERNQVSSLFTVAVVMNIQIFKEEESIEILTFFV